ncbi:MAG: LON peptidase substrate-binding domain-containing protein [Anaerolineales bacterium]
MSVSKSELPLFPLNTVLFPGMPITLYIFESRYKQMMKACLAGERSFGVVLIREGTEAFAPLPAPHSVGCTAKIVQVQRLSEGRMNVVAVGRERFRIVDLHHELPYLTARVVEYPLPLGDPAEVEKRGRRLLPWVAVYLRRLSDFHEMEFERSFLPRGALPLAYLAAHLLQVAARQKQPLLAATDALALLEDLLQLFRREVALIHAMLERQPPEDLGSFSFS